MARWPTEPRVGRLFAVAFAVLLVSTASVVPAWADRQASSPSDAEECLTCHGDTGLTLDLPDKTRKSLHVDLQKFAGSVHQALKCADCHAGMTEIPHPAQSARNARELTIVLQAACRRCHFANYTKTLDSVHATLIARGDLRAPVCVDCHGAHDTRRGNQPRSHISETCARCHGGVYDAYVKSVHGRALVETANRDVPVCTDCHRAHDIGDPRVPAALLSTPEMCGRCHANEAVMRKYGLSTDVLETYLADFHGVTASLQRAGGGQSPRLAALCIDCHGVHDISRASASNSQVMRKNLLTVCRRCHPTASENFSGAWLSHYQPSWRHAPLVYAAKVFYLILIPFIVGGLLLQMLLHFWRVVVNR